MPAPPGAAKLRRPDPVGDRRDGVPEDTRAALAAHKSAQDLRPRPDRAPSSTRRSASSRHVKRISGGDAGQRPRSRSPASTTAPSAGASSTPGTASSSPTRRRPRTPAPRRTVGQRQPPRLLLVTDDPSMLPTALQDYLLDVQPGYDDATRSRRLQPRLDHRRRERRSSVAVQAQIDALLEIVPVNERGRRSPDTMSQAESPDRLATARSPSTTSASSWAPPRRTSSQLRNRIARLIDSPLAADHPRASARRAGRSRASPRSASTARHAATTPRPVRARCALGLRRAAPPRTAMGMARPRARLARRGRACAAAACPGMP